jgi:hypothetical protein
LSTAHHSARALFLIKEPFLFLFFSIQVTVGDRLSENDLVDLGEAKSVERRRVFPERFFAHASSFSSLLTGSGRTGLVPLYR